MNSTKNESGVSAVLSTDELGDLLERMRGFEIDHVPEGWPAIRMRDISALCDAINDLQATLQAVNFCWRQDAKRLAWWNATFQSFSRAQILKMAKSHNARDQAPQPHE